MRRVGLAMLTIAIAGSIGCGMFGDGPPPIGSEVGLTSPWAEMSLPIGEGRVTMSEPESLTVRYDGTASEPVLAAWSEALEEAGWTLEVDTSVPGVVNQSWRREDTSLALSGMERGGEIKVSMSILPF